MHLPKSVLAALMVAATVAAAALPSGHASAQSCDFAPVKKEIDTVLDQDKDRGERFRKRVADGDDSMKVLTQLAPAELRAMIDNCRCFAAEYLAKRGYPPAH